MLSRTGAPIVRIKPTRLGAIRAGRYFLLLPLLAIVTRWGGNANFVYYFFAVTIFYLFISRQWEQVHGELYNLVIQRRFRTTDKDSVRYRTLDRGIARQLKYIQWGGMVTLGTGLALSYDMPILVLNDFLFLYFFYQTLQKTFKLRDVYNRIRHVTEQETDDDDGEEAEEQDVCKQD